MVKLLVTGGTGYIGGDALHVFTRVHPEWDITVLVRDPVKASVLRSAFPNIRPLIGDLDSTHVVEEEARKADVVCHFADATHEAAMKAIIEGLLAHEPSRPGFLIHTSSTAALLGDGFNAQISSTPRQVIYNDLEGLGEVISLPEHARLGVGKLVFEPCLEHDELIKTAVVCPATVYGHGRGPCNNRSYQISALCKAVLERGPGLSRGLSQDICGNVHIEDLSKLYLSLAETAALNVASFAAKPAVWGRSGYYFCESGEHTWADVSQWIDSEAAWLGLSSDDPPGSDVQGEAEEITISGSALWSVHGRSRAKRARAVFGWTPTGACLREEIRSSVLAEAERLSLHVCQCKRRYDEMKPEPPDMTVETGNESSDTQNAMEKHQGRLNSAGRALLDMIMSKIMDPSYACFSARDIVDIVDQKE